jgi:sulfur relay (sulfurtransferase) DsrC/TusE family protein
MEEILTEEEYYDLFKALRFAIEHLPDIVGEHKGLLERLTALYKKLPSEGACEFVITVRAKSATP